MNIIGKIQFYHQRLTLGLTKFIIKNKIFKIKSYKKKCLVFFFFLIKDRKLYSKTFRDVYNIVAASPISQVDVENLFSALNYIYDDLRSNSFFLRKKYLNFELNLYFLCEVMTLFF